MSLLNKASLIQIPSGYKDGTLYSAKPINGDGDFTFSRGSNLAATRVNSEGLIEKGRENVLLQSNSFDTTWANSSTSETSGQTGYDGSSNAWLLTKTASSGYIYQNVSNGGILTFSIYAKVGTLDWIRFVLNGSSNAYQYFDLNNGVLGSGADGKISASITDVGNGYYRCSLAVDNGTISRVRIYPADDNNDTSGTSGNIYIQDAQLESGDIATDYIPTTTTAVSVGPVANVPRLDYSGGGCPKLLLEPQRTNLVTFSEQFDNAVWTPQSGASVSANTTISPDGTQNADTLSMPSSSYLYYLDVTNLTSQKVTLSFYAKGTNGQTIVTRANTSTNDSQYQTHTLTGEWQRIEQTFDGGTYNYIYPFDARQSMTATSMQIWGAQVEAGSYPTSYIPTLSAVSTRGADVCSKTGISSLFGTNQGTFFIDFVYNNSNLFDYLFDVTDASNVNRFLMYDSNGSGLFYFYDSGYAVIDAYQLTKGQRYKIGVKYNSSGTIWYVNGVLSATGTVSFSYQMAQIYLGQKFNLTSQSQIQVNQTILFPTALSNTDLISLTTI